MSAEFISMNEFIRTIVRQARKLRKKQARKLLRKLELALDHAIARHDKLLGLQMLAEHYRDN